MIAAIGEIDETSDRDFLLKLYDENARLMMKTAKKYLPSDSDAEDAVQDTVIKMIENIDRLRALPDVKLAAYIVTMVKHCAFDTLREKNREQSYTVFFGEEGLGDIPDSSRPLDEQVQVLDMKWRLSRVWPKLRERERFLLEGKYILGYSDSEMAVHLGIKPSSVRMLLTRARDHAYELLGKED